jgi:hypothetical protein
MLRELCIGGRGGRGDSLPAAAPAVRRARGFERSLSDGCGRLLLPLRGQGGATVLLRKGDI